MRNLEHTVLGSVLRKKWAVGLCSCMAVVLVASAAFAMTVVHVTPAHAYSICQFTRYVSERTAQNTQSDRSGTYTLQVALWAQVDVHDGEYCGSEYASATLTIPPGGHITDYVLSFSGAKGVASTTNPCPCSGGVMPLKTAPVETQAGYAGGGAFDDNNTAWVLSASTAVYP